MFIAAVVVAIFVAIVAIVGIHLRGTRAVGNTQMMTAARIVVVVGVLLVVFYAFQYR
jgi:hypothetical protein